MLSISGKYAKLKKSQILLFLFIFQAKVFGMEKLRGFAISEQIGAHLLCSGDSALKPQTKPAPKKLVGLEDFVCQCQ